MDRFGNTFLNLRALLSMYRQKGTKDLGENLCTMNSGYIYGILFRTVTLSRSLEHTLITSTAAYGILKSSEQLAAKQNQCL